MATSRRPAYTWGRRTNEKGEALLDSTDAARLLRLHPHDPLFRRYDTLRATGKLRPAHVDPVVLFRQSDVDRLRPDRLDMEPAQGVWKAAVIGAAIGVVAWVAIVWTVWTVLS